MNRAQLRRLEAALEPQELLIVGIFGPTPDGRDLTEGGGKWAVPAGLDEAAFREWCEREHPGSVPHIIVIKVVHSRAELDALK